MPVRRRGIMSLRGCMATTNLDPDLYDAQDAFASPDEPEGAQMTLVEHLTELRRRLFYCVITILVTSVGAFFFYHPILGFLRLPLAGVYSNLIVTGVGEGFTVVFKVSLGVGIALAAPVWLYQVWAFISPALTHRERKYALPFTLIGVLLFIAGLAVGYITLRFPVTWLIGFGRDAGFNELISANNYFSFVLFFMLAFGVTFELPLVMTFLAIIGVISSQRLGRTRPYTIVALWVIATIITPGADPYSPVILGAALTFLYFFSEILIRIIGK
jgi:sec-independent protein translocase protein TatC